MACYCEMLQCTVRYELIERQAPVRTIRERHGSLYFYRQPGGFTSGNDYCPFCLNVVAVTLPLDAYSVYPGEQVTQRRSVSHAMPRAAAVDREVPAVCALLSIAHNDGHTAELLGLRPALRRVVELAQG